MAIRKFIIASTMLGVLSSGIAISWRANEVHYLYFYFLMVFNLFLLVWLRSLWLPKGLIFFLAFLLFSGILGFLQGTDSVALFLKSFIGIFLSAVYFAAFFRYIRFDVGKYFAIYAKLACYAALLGLLYLPLDAALHGMYRLHGVFREPSDFVEVCVPALFYYADRWQRLGQGGWNLVLLLVAFALAISATGFMGCLFGLYLLGTRYRFGKVVAPAIVVFTGVGLYSLSPDFRIRFDDTVVGLVAGDTNDLNLSSFAIVANTFVTLQTVEHYPLFGGGLGSHPLNHDRYSGNIAGIDTYVVTGLDAENRTDAGSLFLRLLSETGLVGTGLAFWFIWRFRPVHVSENWKYISFAILTYFFVKLLRSGIYFNPEEFFFLTAYAVIGSPKLREARAHLPSTSFAVPTHSDLAAEI